MQHELHAIIYSTVCKWLGRRVAARESREGGGVEGNGETREEALRTTILIDTMPFYAILYTILYILLYSTILISHCISQ